MLGDGEIALQSLLHNLHHMGYAGDCVLEIFSESVPDSLWESKATVIDAVERSIKTYDHIRTKLHA